MYTTEQLIEQIKENTSTEFAQGRFSQSTIINLCNQESVKRIKPIVADLASEFFVVAQRITVAAAIQNIRLPKRAASRGIRKAYIEISSERYSLSQITREEATIRQNDGTGIPSSFFFEADSMVFNCQTDQEITLVLVLEISCGNLVLSTAVTTVSSVDLVTGVVVVAGNPSGFGSTVEYDFVQQLGYGNAALGVSLTPISTVGTTYTFDPDELPKTLRAGDYVTLAGQTPVPNMPDEAVVCLIHAVSLRIFRSRGDFQAVGAEQAELTNAIIYLERSLADRSEGNRTTVKPTGLLRQRSWGRRFY